MAKISNLHLAKKLKYYSIHWSSDAKCFYCGVALTRKTRSLDHLVPRARGGTNNFKNIVICCRPCNCAKSDLTVSEFSVFVAAHGGYTRVHKQFGNRPDSRRDWYKWFMKQNQRT